MAEGPIHESAFSILGKRKRKSDLVFNLPSSTTANKILDQWMKSIGKTDKKVTWHWVRHSFNMWAKRRNYPGYIRQGMLGHKTEKLGDSVYNHFSMEEAIKAQKGITINRVEVSSYETIMKENQAMVDKLLKAGATFEQIQPYLIPIPKMVRVA